MAELTQEQRRAIAIATAKKRAAEAQQGRPNAPIQSRQDVTNAFAQWADEQNAKQQASFVEGHPMARKAAKFLQGLPFIGSYADEAIGGAAAATGGAPDAATGAAMVRALQRGEDERNPGGALTMEIGGGILGTGIGLAAAGPAIMSMAPQSLGMRMGAGAAAGAVGGAMEGAVYGSGDSEGAGRGTNAITGGAVGGVLGGTLGAAVPAAASGIGAIAKRLMDSRTADKVMAPYGLSRPARQILDRALVLDGNASPGARNPLRGNDSMLADSGPAAQAPLDLAVQSSGPAAGMARGAIDARAVESGKQINSALDSRLGAPAGVTATETALRRGTASARKTAYDAAYAAPVNYASPEGRAVEDLLRRVPDDVLAKANRLMKLKDETSAQILFDIADDGSVTYRQMPDVRQLDYITRALNAAAESGDGAGALGGQTAMGAAYQSLSRSIRDNVRRAVPAYDAALSTAADPISRRKALLLGNDMLKPGTTRDLVAEQVEGMTGPERDAVRQGVRSYIDDVLANVSRVASDPNVDAREAMAAYKMLTSRAAKDKLESVLGARPAKVLIGRIEQAGKGLELRANVATNSRTQSRTAMQDMLNDYIQGGMVNRALEGKPLQASQELIQALTGRDAPGRQAMNDKVLKELVRALTGPRGRDAAKLLDALRQSNNAGQINAGRAAAIGRGAGMGLMSLGYGSGTQLNR